ncbi:MAG: hypothetical protein QGD91_03025 [Actinomycetota bacterium]|nr:hypothetical protein [Actinomycetota bacterium]
MPEYDDSTTGAGAQSIRAAVEGHGTADRDPYRSIIERSLIQLWPSSGWFALG